MLINSYLSYRILNRLLKSVNHFYSDFYKNYNDHNGNGNFLATPFIKKKYFIFLFFFIYVYNVNCHITSVHF